MHGIAGIVGYNIRYYRREASWPTRNCRRNTAIFFFFFLAFMAKRVVKVSTNG